MVSVTPALVVITMSDGEEKQKKECTVLLCALPSTYSMCRNSIPDSIYHCIPRDIWASTSRYDPPAIWAEINYGPSKWSASSCNGQPPLRVNQPMLLPPSLHTLVLPPGPRSTPHPYPCPTPCPPPCPPPRPPHCHAAFNFFARSGFASSLSFERRLNWKPRFHHDTNLLLDVRSL